MGSLSLNEIRDRAIELKKIWKEYKENGSVQGRAEKIKKSLDET